uniref:GCR086 n=1 Tax=Schmidtea mediterranea TaxID=79327 RepID=A0A193KUA7_SCHMD|nr:GCR086 [Schmidtea mediterranea]
MNESKNFTDQKLLEEKKIQFSSMLIFIIPFLGILGNVIICVSIKIEKKLQKRFNYFLLSLACSDLLNSIFVMPVSAWKFIDGHNYIIMTKVLPVIGRIELGMGKGLVYIYFLFSITVNKIIFNFTFIEIIHEFTSNDNVNSMQNTFVFWKSIWFCTFWFSLDVFFTSSSIIHLCVISLDRYIVLRNPFKSHRYRKKCFKIGLTCSWILSAAVAGPIFIFAYRIQHQEKISYKGCGPNETYFIVLSTVLTFYLPLLIMTLTYSLTVISLKKQNKEMRGNYFVYKI